MNIQDLILISYQLILRQLKRFGLPLTLVICYLSAIGLRRVEVLASFDRVEMEQVHLGFGLLLCSVLVAILYDRLQQKRKSTGEGAFKHGYTKSRLKKISELGPRYWVDLIFFICLSFIAVLGLALYLKTKLGWLRWINLEMLYAAHSTLVWYFLSLILVRYYLTLTRWVGSVLVYLRAH